jgi:diguanylate cyclase (GGDEF)-like protein
VTLRGRLTTAFLAAVLGPVLLGAVFVAGTVSAVTDQQAEQRLALAADAVRTSVAALCQQLHAAADAVALVGDPGRAGVATQVVARGLAGGVVVGDPAGGTTFTTADPPPRPWADCATPTPVGSPVRALAVRVELRDPAGTSAGAVSAARPLDGPFLSWLASTTGTAVTVLDADPAAVSTEPAGTRSAVLAAAGRIHGDQTARAQGRYVRRVGPSPGQPLPLVLSVAPHHPTDLYAVLVGTVLGAGLLAVLAAWRLARSTTRPLTELATAVARVADGDLAARVPVSTYDEVGRLASTVNRMTRETASYVQALTTSRDQLRNHLAVLGDTLASTHDLQRILRVILRTAVRTTGARAGVVLLVDQPTGTLVGQCTEGLDRSASTADGTGPATVGTAPTGPATVTGGREHPGGNGRPLDAGTIRLPLGRGLLGRVAVTGEARRGRVERDGPAPLPDEPHCRTYVAVPFAAPGVAEEPTGAVAVPVALGVLALYDRLGGDEFDDTDLDTLRTFARRAAVAVDNVRVHEEVQRLSLTDPLTGLWNYRYLKESIRREVERASRFGRTISVLALDLDRFKEVNDTYGHAAGDAVLAEFARRVRGVVREVDLAFRQGGEEFVLLLPETDARGAATVAERLGAAVRDTPVVLNTPGSPHPAARIRVTVSIGIAVYPDHATTGQRVLDAADDALYAAKAAGRDTYRVAVPADVAGAGPGVDSGGPRTTDAVSAPAPGGASSGPHPPRQSRGR